MIITVKCTFQENYPVNKNTNIGKYKIILLFICTLVFAPSADIQSCNEQAALLFIISLPVGKPFVIHDFVAFTIFKSKVPLFQAIFQFSFQSTFHNKTLCPSRNSKTMLSRVAGSKLLGLK